jgi:hypothetical protein
MVEMATEQAGPAAVATGETIEQMRERLPAALAVTIGRSDSPPRELVKARCSFVFDDGLVLLVSMSAATEPSLPERLVVSATALEGAAVLAKCRCLACLFAAAARRASELLGFEVPFASAVVTAPDRMALIGPTRQELKTAMCRDVDRRCVKLAADLAAVVNSFGDCLPAVLARRRPWWRKLAGRAWRRVRRVVRGLPRRHEDTNSGRKQ